MSRFWVVAFLFLSHTVHVASEELSVFRKGMKYQEIKALHEQRLQEPQTKVQQLEDFRSIIRASRYGERGLNRIFKNFEGNYAINPSIPGVAHTVRLISSASNSQSKGYVRELLYAASFNNDPRFQLVKLNDPLRRNWGNTDADMVIRHKATGLYARIEVKDVSLASQTTNLKKLKVQLDKMSMERQLTGQPQFWVNRREVHPEILRYAKSKGIGIYGNVSTGEAQTKGLITSRTFIDQVDHSIDKVARKRSTTGAGQSANGVWLLIESAPAVFEDIETLAASDQRKSQDWARLVMHSTPFVAGVGLIGSGALKSASSYSGEYLQGKFNAWGRRIGGLSYVLLLGDEANLILKYRAGDVSSRDFWTAQWLLSASMTGAYVGGYTGVALGTMLPYCGLVCGNIGGLVGGLGGRWLGELIARRWVNVYYDMKFSKIDQAFGKSVVEHYKD